MTTETIESEADLLLERILNGENPISNPVFTDTYQWYGDMLTRRRLRKQFSLERFERERREVLRVLIHEYLMLETVFQLKDDGENFKSIADKLGKNPETIKKWLKGSLPYHLSKKYRDSLSARRRDLTEEDLYGLLRRYIIHLARNNEVNCLSTPDSLIIHEEDLHYKQHFRKRSFEGTKLLELINLTQTPYKELLKKALTYKWHRFFISFGDNPSLTTKDMMTALYVGGLTLEEVGMIARNEQDDTPVTRSWIQYLITPTEEQKQLHNQTRKKITLSSKIEESTGISSRNFERIAMAFLSKYSIYDTARILGCELTLLKSYIKQRDIRTLTVEYFDSLELLKLYFLEHADLSSVAMQRGDRSRQAIYGKLLRRYGNWPNALIAHGIDPYKVYKRKIRVSISPNNTAS
ncbi:MAG: hypothetical protein HYS80_00960 [Candidatus Aenigmarchaeota archaeon]|nr:hypothetical protein [Candidatus Aenigmarchaeota archaeon]